MFKLFNKKMKNENHLKENNSITSTSKYIRTKNENEISNQFNKIRR